MNTNCPNVEKCPIFKGILKDRKMTTKSYQQLYCVAGAEKYSTCKRYETKAKYGVCPPDLLPNSTLTLEQIASKYNLQPHP
ncbi:hypothetical protein [Carboxylicivirga taeanensis]|uniref:hypothetical protein n=1 Tax=Carboxylicivirga taeanensis TaxID=1416875 RepID=UPI003F6E09E7